MTQKDALSILKTGANAFLTGEPGAGKTYTINQYIDWLRLHKHEPAITASTGIAATHIKGQTIHSWSGMGIKEFLSSFDIEMLMEKEYLMKRLNKPKVLIIDEVSMISAQFLDSLDQLLRRARGSEHAFGGMQVIFVGDFFQLPPVSRNEVQYAFASNAWRNTNPLILYLDEQFRQHDEAFVSLLKSIRSADVDEGVFATLEERVCYDEVDSDATRLYTHNSNVDQENTRKLEELTGKVKVFSMKGEGKKDHIEVLKKGCMSPDTLALKINAKVMFTKNNPQAKYVNGTLGLVCGFSALGYPLVETASGDIIEALPLEWASELDGKVLAKVTQVPLRLAWALTIHKSQGVTLDSAVIDLSKAFAFGQGYVALSRLTSLSGLTLTGFRNDALKVSPDVIVFDRASKKMAQQAREYFSHTLTQEDVKKLHTQFIKALS
jgi:ATP-dependent DNA helicase PIF1